MRIYSSKKHKKNKTQFLRLFQNGVLFLAITFNILTCMAQQPFQDAKGEGTLFINEGGFAQINVADPSIRLGYLRDVSNDTLTFGVNLSGKLTGTRANFINNNRVAPDAQIAFTVGKKYLLSNQFDASKIVLDQKWIASFQDIFYRQGFLDKGVSLPSPENLLELLERTNQLQVNELKRLLDTTPITATIPTSPQKQSTGRKAFVEYFMYLTTFCDARLTNDNVKDLLEKAIPVSEVLRIVDDYPTGFDTKQEAIDALKELPKSARDTSPLFPEIVIKAMTQKKDVSKFCKIKGKNIADLFDTEELKKYATFDRLLFQGGYGFRQYNLFDPNASLDKQLYKKDFHNLSAQLIYFRLIGGNKLFGASVGVQKSNNSNGLIEVEVRDFDSLTNNGTIREVSQTRKALRGDFKQSTRAFINTDFAVFPRALNSRIGINFFTRTGLTGDERGIQPGIGLFFSEKGAPTRVIGGASVSLVDGKPNVSLIAGYNF